MIWFVCECPKCLNSDFEVDMDRTISHYDDLYDLGSEPVALLKEEPPFSPDEFMMVCENPSCGHTDKWTVEKLVTELRNSLSRYAWAERKRNRPERLFSLEDTLVQHFIESGELDESEFADNAYVRKLYLKAHGKKS